MKLEEKSPNSNKDNLLFDFIVDEATKKYLLRENLQPNYPWFGTHLPHLKSLTNGLHPLLGYRKQNI
jgi:hypothetical protein